VPPAPESLKEPGRATWSEIWSGPAQEFLSMDLDASRVTALCHLSDEIAEYRRLIDGMGPVLLEAVVTPTGKVASEKRVVPNPLVKMLRDAERALARDRAAVVVDQSRPARGRNREATDKLVATLRSLGRIDDIDATRVMTLQALADAVDRDPFNASLWNQYRAAEVALRGSDDSDDDAYSQLLGKLSAQVGDQADAIKTNARRGGSRRRS